MKNLPPARALGAAAASVLLVGACSTAGDGGFHLQIGPDAWNLRHRATLEHRTALELAPGDVLVLEGVHGDVTVRAGDEGSFLSARLTAAARTQDEAEELVQGARLETPRDGKELRALVIAPDGAFTGASGRARLEVDLEALVPRGVSVRIQTASGRVAVDGPVAGVRARTSFGDVRVTQALDGVVAGSGSGEIVLSDVRGPRLVAETAFGDVTLERAEADLVEASSSSGDLVLRGVRARTIGASSTFGDVTLEDVEGDVSAKTASGDLVLRRAARGTHVLHSGFGRVEAQDAVGVLRASSNGGAVLLSGADGDVEASSGFGRVQVSGILVRVVAETSSGDVVVHAREGSAVTTDWRLASGFGRVELGIEDELACELELKTSFGDVACDFPLAEREEKAGGSVRGRIGAGGRRVVLDAAQGDVAVRRRR